MDTLAIALPPSVVDRDTPIDLTIIRPEVLFQCLLLGLRARVFDFLDNFPRDDRLEGEWVAAAIEATFADLSQPADSEESETLIITVPRFVDGAAIYDVSDAVEPLDLASVPSVTRLELIMAGFRSFPVKELPARLLAEKFVLPGDE